MLRCLNLVRHCVDQNFGLQDTLINFSCVTGSSQAEDVLQWQICICEYRACSCHFQWTGTLSGLFSLIYSTYPPQAAIYQNQDIQFTFVILQQVQNRKIIRSLYISAGASSIQCNEKRRQNEIFSVNPAFPFMLVLLLLHHSSKHAY